LRFSNALSTAFWLRVSRTFFSLAICAGAHLGDVDGEDVDLVGIGRAEPVDADDHVLALVDARLLRAAASSMRIFGRPSSTALVMPPSASTSWISSHALSARSFVSARHSRSRRADRRHW
jgi:hypothetical protein